MRRVTVGSLSGTAAGGQPAAAPLTMGLPPAAGLPLGTLQGKVDPGLGAAPGPLTVFIELIQPPAVDVYSAERRAKRTAPASAAAARIAGSRVGQAADRLLDRLMERYCCPRRPRLANLGRPPMERIAGSGWPVDDVRQAYPSGCPRLEYPRAVLCVAAGNLRAAEGPTTGVRALEVAHAARGNPW